jgi:acetate kinase
VDALLNKRSGLLGVCGDSDLRAIIERSKAGDARAQLALDMFVYRCAEAGGLLARGWLGAAGACWSGR